MQPPPPPPLLLLLLVCSVAPHGGSRLPSSRSLSSSSTFAADRDEAQRDWVYAYPDDYAESSMRQAQLLTWADEDPLCTSGRHQSPLDILTEHVARAPFLNDRIVAHLAPAPFVLINNGRGFQLHGTGPDPPASLSGDELRERHGLRHEGDDGWMTYAVSGVANGYTMLRGERYNLYQVHFHTPSENTIDGRSFPLEAHFVHQLADSELRKVDGGERETLVGMLDHLAVISVLYEDSGDECDPVLDEFWHLFPVAEQKTIVAPINATFDLSRMLTADMLHGGYFHWDGSLTTPPCTEGVDWNLLHTRLRVCPAQVARLQEALAASQGGVRVNSRVTQDLNQRVVTTTAPSRLSLIGRFDDPAFVVAVAACAAAAVLSLLLCCACFLRARHHRRQFVATRGVQLVDEYPDRYQASCSRSNGDVRAVGSGTPRSRPPGSDSGDGYSASDSEAAATPCVPARRSQSLGSPPTSASSTNSSANSATPCWTPWAGRGAKTPSRSSSAGSLATPVSGYACTPACSTPGLSSASANSAGSLTKSPRSEKEQWM